MSKLLVSIKNLHEARMIVDAGVDILDVKEPQKGPLGRASWKTLKEIGEFRHAVRNAPSTWSCAMGELCDWSTTDNHKIGAALEHFDLAKIGLSNMRSLDWPAKLGRFWAELPSHISPVLVAYVDHDQCDAPDIDTILARLPEIRSKQQIQYFLFDTYRKGPGLNLFSYAEPQKLSRWIVTLQDWNIKTCIAGSIQETILSTALELQADFLGVRSVVCFPDRTGGVSADLLEQFLDNARRELSNL